MPAATIGAREGARHGQHVHYRGAHLGHLPVGDIACRDAPVVERCIAGVAAEAAGEAGDAFLDRLAAAVERGVLIDAVRQLAEDAAHVGHVGEAAGGEPLLAPTKLRALRDDAHVGARQPGVDKLPAREAVAVGEAARPRLAARDGNDVCRRRAHVDEQSVGEAARDEGRAGEKVHRSDARRLGASPSRYRRTRAGPYRREDPRRARWRGARGSRARRFAGRGTARTARRSWLQRAARRGR